MCCGSPLEHWSNSVTRTAIRLTTSRYSPIVVRQPRRLDDKLCKGWERRDDSAAISQLRRHRGWTPALARSNCAPVRGGLECFPANAPLYSIRNWLEQRPGCLQKTRFHTGSSAKGTGRFMRTPQPHAQHLDRLATRRQSPSLAATVRLASACRAGARHGPLRVLCTPRVMGRQAVRGRSFFLP